MNKLVCVVDDDELVRAKIAHDLEAAGFRPLEIDDTRQLSRVLAELPVHGVVLDLVMPDKDGVELISEIRRDWPNLRVVAISGGGRIGPDLYLQIARQMGADACLSKPVDPAALAAAMAA